MVITYHGQDCFKISQGDLTLVVNPKSKMAADVTLFTHGRSPIFAEASPGKAGFVIDGPGEYEIKDIFIKGFPDYTFLITFEGIKLCFLGIGAEKDELEDVDILFTSTDAYKSAVALEPAVIIPMNYTEASLKQFLKEAGETKVEPLDKLVIKKKDLEGKEGEVIVLKKEE